MEFRGVTQLPAATHSPGSIQQGQFFTRPFLRRFRVFSSQNWYTGEFRHLGLARLAFSEANHEAVRSGLLYGGDCGVWVGCWGFIMVGAQPTFPLPNEDQCTHEFHRLALHLF